MLAVLGVLAFGVALVVGRVLLSSFGRFGLDEPNKRSLHERPVPRTGGIAVLAGASVSLAFGAGELWVAMALALGLGAVSLVDDLRGLPTGLRLIAHLVAAALATLHYASIPAAGMVLVVVAVAWITNLYNFMDGSDGLAGGMAVIGFGAYAVAAHINGNGPLLLVPAALAAAALAFLMYNFPPARIFMGDVGSIPLGFLAAVLGVIGWQGGLWPLWFPVLVFGPFIGDATITLLKRGARFQPVWQAHTEHYYQRLVRMGFGHRGTALMGYVLMGICAVLALFARNQPPIIQWTTFGVAAAGLGAFALWVDWRWARFVR